MQCILFKMYVIVDISKWFINRLLAAKETSTNLEFLTCDTCPQKKQHILMNLPLSIVDTVIFAVVNHTWQL